MRPRDADSLGGEQGVDELRGLEGLEILDALSDADQLAEKLQLPDDPDHDAAPGRAVELGQAHAGQPYCLMERLSLRESVLAGGSIEHHQRLVRGARELPFD